MAFVERKLKSVAWDTPGTKLKGRLKKVARMKFKDGFGLRYSVREGDGTMIEFAGATNLNSKLSDSDTGCMIYVEYLGEDTNKEARDGMSRAKLFKVMVDESDREQSSATAITDEDIPF